MSKFVKFFALINACLSSLLAVSETAVSSIANVEPPSTEPSTAKFFKILEYTQLTVRQISSGSSQNWSIGTDFTHVPVCVTARPFTARNFADPSRHGQQSDSGVR